MCVKKKKKKNTQRGIALPPPHGLLFYMHYYTDMIVHAMAFATPVVEQWLEREIAQWIQYEGSMRVARQTGT